MYINKMEGFIGRQLHPQIIKIPFVRIVYDFFKSSSDSSDGESSNTRLGARDSVW